MTIDEEELIESIESPLRSGFGTPDPAHPDWRSTRPGARSGERLAYVRESEEGKSFISIVEREGGEVDEDGYEWSNDAYVIIASLIPVGKQERVVASTEREAAETVSQIMQEQ